MNLKTFEEMQHTSVFFIPGITAEARIITDRTTVLRMVLRKLDFINQKPIASKGCVAA